MRRLLLVVLLTFPFSFSGAESSVTYTFPHDSCQNDQFKLPSKDGAKLYINFNGDFGKPGCRTMSFDVPQSIFWYSKVCLKLLFYNSLKCESSVFFLPSTNKQFEDYWGNWNDNDYQKAMSGMGCSLEGYQRLDDGLTFCSQYYTMFDVQLRKNDKKKEKSKVYRYDWRSTINLRTTTQASLVPNRINDTFSLQITSTLEYRVDVIGGISGGLIGLIVLIVIITRICRCLRRRKQFTGRYFSKCKCDGVKNYVTLSEGFSTECSVAGILLCSCVLCGRHDRHKNQPEKGEISECYKEPEVVTESSKVSEDVKSNGKDKGKWPSIDSLEKTDASPLIYEI